MFGTALYKIYVIRTFCGTVVVLNLQSSALREVSAYPRGPKTVLVRLAKFLLETLEVDHEFDSRSDQVKDYTISFAAYLD